MRRPRIGKKDSGPLAGARGEEEEIGPATVKSRSPGGKVLLTKIRRSGGTHLLITLESLTSPIDSLYGYHQKNRCEASAARDRTFWVLSEPRLAHTSRFGLRLSYRQPTEGLAKPRSRLHRETTCLVKQIQGPPSHRARPRN
jgi:hypothetical protein